ncbi:N-acetylmuramoyl-L-alanine amidase [Sporosarcina sp. CAU 1771]
MKILRCAALLLIFTTIVSLAPVKSYAQTSFKDVKVSDEYFKEVNYIANKDIISGYTEKDGTKSYRPEKNITRFQAAKMVVEASGNQNYNANHITLKNIRPGTEEYHYISKAVALGFFKTQSDGSLKLNEHIDRAELAYALSKAFNLSTNITENQPTIFSDINQGDSYINGLYYAGVTRGSNGKFGKSQLLTRGQFALFVARALDKQFALPVQSTNSNSIAQGKVNEDSLNVRTSPSVSSGNVIGSLKKGQNVTVIKDDGDWVEIKHWSRPAFVSKKYINFLDSDSKPIGSASYFAKIKTDGTLLNVRTLPSTSGTIIGKLNSDDVVEVYGIKGSWSLILVNGIPGYIHSNYTVPVQDEIETPTPPSQTTGDLIGKVTVSSLNVRASASTGSAILSKLSLGTKVDVLSLEGTWAKIKFNTNDIGFVDKTFLKLLNTNPNEPLKNRIIVLDPGHGAHDPGANRAGVTEKSIALTVSNLVSEKLKKAGAKVLVTRSNDTYLTLQQRTDFAKKSYAETFVSIHVNAASSTAAKGTEVWIDSATNPNGSESKVLARYVLNNLVRDAGMVNRGVKDTNFFVIRNNNVAAILIELGFISNKDDFAKLTNSRFLEIYAESIYQGLVQYYSID